LFGNWTVDGEVLDSGSTIEVLMDTDHTATATCIPLYTLTVTNDGCWGIEVMTPGWQYGEWVEGNATFVLPEGTPVTLTSSDGDGIAFTGWYVDAEGSPRLGNPLIITMDADHQVTAVCVNEYNLYVTSAGCCSILVSGLPGGNQTVGAGNSTAFYHLLENTQITLAAQPGYSCMFVNWTVDSGLPISNPTIEVVMDDNHTAILACNVYNPPIPIP